MRLQRGKAFWKGSVRIRVTGREPERFFNLCGHHNITLWDVTEHKGCFEMSLLPEDFFRLLPIRRKSGTLHAVAVHLEYSCGRKLREQYADDLKQP